MTNPICKYWRNIAGIALSAMLQVAAMWQLEVVNWALLMGSKNAYFPFFFFGPVDLWIFRDLWDLMLVAAWILLFVSLWWWE